MDGSLAAPIARLSGIATSATVKSFEERGGPGEAAVDAMLLMNTDVGFNMLQEFWPEIKRTLLFRRK